MKIIRQEEYRFTFEEVAEILKQMLFNNEKLCIDDEEKLFVQHDEQGNFVIHHKPDTININ